MPAYTPIRDFINALRDGETNITRRIKYLVMNYNHPDVPPAVQALLDPNSTTKWNPNVSSSSAIPGPIKDLLMHQGPCGTLSAEFKLIKDEVDHIDALDPLDKAKVLAWVNAAKNNPAAEIWWELRREPLPGGLPGDDVVYDPAIPLKITGRTWGGRVDLGWSGFNLGSIKYNKP
jgi:hypothetical protein